MDTQALLSQLGDDTRKHVAKCLTLPQKKRSEHRNGFRLTGFPPTEQWGRKRRRRLQPPAPRSAAPALQTREGEEPRNRKRKQAAELAAAGLRERGAGMELRALWLLCCCFCCCGRAADPRATFTATEPRSRERQAAAFRESLHRHRYLNSVFPGENSSAVYGINQFSHLFPEEFKAIYLRSKTSRLPRYRAEVQTSIPNVSLPLRFDWRDKRVVTQVRNQQTCGGCWAFSVVGAVESAYAIKGKPLEDLSVQQVIDCSYNNYGCNGGSTLNALNWLNKTHVKLVRDSEYPFKAQNGLCRYFSDSHFGFSIKGYSAYDFRNTVIEYIKCTKKWVNPLLMLSASLPVNSRLLRLWGVKSYMWTFNYVEVRHPYPWVHDDFSHLLESLDSSVTEMTPVCSWNLNLAMWNFTDYTLPVPSDQEDEMAKALVTFGPLVVVVDAVSWQDYLGGIIQHHCSSGEANHAVLITGFDKIGNLPYWIVRNSWGSSWGVDGYAHVKMGGNICGIADSVSAVFV